MTQVPETPSNLGVRKAQSDVLPSTFSPALARSLYLAALLPYLLGSTTLFLALRFYWLAAPLIQHFLSTTCSLAARIQYVAMVLAKRISGIAKANMESGWKAVETLRKKLFFEFMVFLLGGGYAMLLIILWPGWILIASAALALWFLRG